MAATKICFQTVCQPLVWLLIVFYQTDAHKSKVTRLIVCESVIDNVDMIKYKISKKSKLPTKADKTCELH